jgi:hypothetical protein
MCFPQGRDLHLSETRLEFLAESPRKISPVYPSAPVARGGFRLGYAAVSA